MVAAGLPRTDGGMIDIEAGLQWVRNNITRKNGGPGSGESIAQQSGIGLTEARRLKVLADTEMVKLQLGKEKGELVNKREIRLALAEFVRGQKVVIANFPNRFGPQLAADINHQDARHLVIVLDLYMRKLLEELHNQRPIKLSQEDEQ